MVTELEKVVNAIMMTTSTLEKYLAEDSEKMIFGRPVPVKIVLS